jgi:hypothetical protein
MTTTHRPRLRAVVSHVSSTAAGFRVLVFGHWAACASS